MCTGGSLGLLGTDLRGPNGHRGVKEAVAGGHGGLGAKQGPPGYRTGWLGSQWGYGWSGRFGGVCANATCPAWGSPPRRKVG